MTDQERKVMKLALEALEWSWGGEPLGTKEFEAMAALRQSLAQPEQEPIAWDIEGYGDPACMPDANHTIPLYTAPSNKPWVSLTDIQIINTANEAPFDQMVKADDYIYIIARAIESASKELNHG
jgi:hypothetical protein